MGVLVAATLVEHACGELAMVGVFWGAACAIPSPTASTCSGRSSASCSLSAQLAMGVTTGSVLLDARRRDAGVHLRPHPRRRVARPAPPRLAAAAAAARAPRARRRAAVQPPFLRVLAAPLSSTGSAGCRRGRSSGCRRRSRSRARSPSGREPRPPPRSGAATVVRRGAGLRAELTGGWLRARAVSGVYRYTCADRRRRLRHAFTYRALWMRPAAVAPSAPWLPALKLLLMHAYAALFMLLAQGNCRDARGAQAVLRPDQAEGGAPPARQAHAGRAGDLCAFCHEELAKPPPDDDGHRPPADPQRPPYATAAGAAARRSTWRAPRRGAATCVYCSSAMWG